MSGFAGVGVASSRTTPSSSSKTNKRLRKLATEYNKLKAHNGELQRALAAEEQKRRDLEAQVAQLQSEGKDKEHELSSLRFNVERLTKRCNHLISQLTKAGKQLQKRRMNTSWVGSLFVGSGVSREAEKLREQMDVTSQELQAKIEENEQLHMAMFDAKEEHEATLGIMQRKIEELKAALSDHRQDKHDQSTRLEERVQQLEHDVADRDESIQQLTQQLGGLREQAANVTRERDNLLRANNESWRAVERMQQRLAERLLFDDGAQQAFNMVSLPSFDRALVLAKQEVTADASAMLRKLRPHLMALVTSLGAKMSRVKLTRSSSMSTSSGGDVEAAETHSRLQELLLLSATMPADIGSCVDRVVAELDVLVLRLSAQADQCGPPQARANGTGHRNTANGTSPRKMALFSTGRALLDCLCRLVYIQLDALQQLQRYDMTGHDPVLVELRRSRFFGARRAQTTQLLQAWRHLHALLQSGAERLSELAALQDEHTLPFYCNWVLDFLMTRAPEYLSALKAALLQLSSRFAAKVSVDHKLAFATKTLKDLNNKIVSELTVLQKGVGHLTARASSFRDHVLCSSAAFRDLVVDANASADEAKDATNTERGGADGHNATHANGNNSSQSSAQHPFVFRPPHGAVDLDVAGLQSMHRKSVSYLQSLSATMRYPSTPTRAAVPYQEALANRELVNEFTADANKLQSDLVSLFDNVDAVEQMLQDAVLSPEKTAADLDPRVGFAELTVLPAPALSPQVVQFLRDRTRLAATNSSGGTPLAVAQSSNDNNNNNNHRASPNRSAAAASRIRALLANSPANAVAALLRSPHLLNNNDRDYNGTVKPQAVSPSAAAPSTPQSSQQPLANAAEDEENERPVVVALDFDKHVDVDNRLKSPH